jgi:hypothetical protein
MSDLTRTRSSPTKKAAAAAFIERSMVLSASRKDGADGAAQPHAQADAHGEIVHCNTHRTADRGAEADTQAHIAAHEIVWFHIHTESPLLSCCAFNIRLIPAVFAFFLSECPALATVPIRLSRRRGAAKKPVTGSDFP